MLCRGLAIHPLAGLPPIPVLPTIEIRVRVADLETCRVQPPAAQEMLIPDKEQMLVPELVPVPPDRQIHIHAPDILPEALLNREPGQRLNREPDPVHLPEQRLFQPNVRPEVVVLRQQEPPLQAPLRQVPEVVAVRPPTLRLPILPEVAVLRPVPDLRPAARVVQAVVPEVVVPVPVVVDDGIEFQILRSMEFSVCEDFQRIII